MKHKILIITLLVLAVSHTFAQTEVTFYTNKGTFVVNLEETKRPLTTANFIKLVKAKFYDNHLFYRVIKNFVIQGGDGDGSNVPAINDELTTPFSNVQKTIAMANAGPNTASSEIYINLIDNTNLDKNYTAFGTVITNFDVVQTIGNVATTGSNGNPADKPLNDIIMDSVRITSNTTAINETINELVTPVFPNPTKGIIYFPHTHISSEDFVTDVMGNRVVIPACTTDNRIDLRPAPAGIYFLHLHTTQGMELRKIMKE